MLNRHKTILYMMGKAGGAVSKLALNKWAFLLREETPSRGGESFYQFLPYLYGPYSFCLDHEMSVLVRDGFVEEPDDRTWSLRASGFEGSNSLPGPVRVDVRKVMACYGSMPVGELLERVYSRNPWFTLNSRDVARRSQERPLADLGVYTMGYEGLMVDGFLDTLLRQGIRALLDVRHDPVSRRFGFHRKTLSCLCEAVGITYHHFPELGIPSRFRKRPAEDPEALFSWYREERLSGACDVVEKVAGLILREPGVLVCMESDPSHCHRSHLASAVASLTRLPIVHLRGGDEGSL